MSLTINTDNPILPLSVIQQQGTQAIEGDGILQQVAVMPMNQTQGTPPMTLMEKPMTATKKTRSAERRCRVSTILELVRTEIRPLLDKEEEGEDQLSNTDKNFLYKLEEAEKQLQDAFEDYA